MSVCGLAISQDLDIHNYMAAALINERFCIWKPKLQRQPDTSSPAMSAGRWLR
jgi:hypothetical protein